MRFAKYSTFLLTVFCSLFLVLQVKAQEVRDNFSSGTIYDLKKDQLGRIWMATDNGVYVSDGLNFIQIPVGDFALTNSPIREIQMYKDELYLIFQKNGLVQLNLNTLKYNKITDQPVASILIEDSSNLFVLLNNGKLEKVILKDKGNPIFIKKTKIDVNQDNSPLMTKISTKYLLIASTNQGIYKINKQTGFVEKKLNIIPDGYDNMFSSFNDKIFFINNHQLFELDNHELFVKSNYVKQGNNLTYILPISATSKLVVRSKKRIFLEKGDKILEYNLSKTKNFEIRDALYNNDNNILFGSNQGLIKVNNVQQKTVSIYDTSIQMEEFVNVRRKIIPISENSIALFGFPKSHIYHLDSKKFTPISNKTSSLFDAVIIKNMFIATSDGGGVKTGIIGSDNMSHIITKDIDTIQIYKSICDIEYLKKDNVLIGGKDVIIFYNYKTKESRLIQLNKNNAFINQIKVDTNSKLIYLATEKGLFYYDLIKGVIVKKTKIKGDDIIDFFIVEKNDKHILWYISNSGLTGLDLRNNQIIKHIDIANFNQTKLTALIADQTNRIWVSSYSGIYAYEYPNNNIVKFQNGNTLINQEYNYKSAAYLNKNQIIFGGLNGYDIINVNLFENSHKSIRGTILGYSTYGLNSRTYNHFDPNEIVQYNTENYYLEFYFSMKEFEKFKLTQFEYQIDNFGWLPTQGLSYLYMYNLKDGLHTLRIRGLDESGNTVYFDTVKVNQYTDFIKSTNFRYFLLFIVIILLVIIGFVYYYNIQEVNRIKENIAMDLHDEIGTILNRTLFTIKDDPNLYKHPYLFNYLSEALYSIRTYIKAFNAENISLLQLIDEIKEQSAGYFKNTNVQCQTFINIDKDTIVNSYLYRDLKLMIFEINQNILKHAHATEVINTFSMTGNSLLVSIKDNGELKEIQAIERKGNGITNIRKRVSRLKGEVQFSINPIGNGLHIEIKLNLA